MPNFFMTQDQIVAVIRRSWAEPDFRAKLVAAPRDTLEAEGIAVPQGLTLQILEDTPHLVHIPLPGPPDGEMSEDALDRLAGGSLTEFLTWFFKVPERIP